MRPRNDAQGRPNASEGERLRGPREIIAELRRVTWPTRPEAVRLTIMVLIVTAFIGAILSSLDWVFSQIVNALLVSP